MKTSLTLALACLAMALGCASDRPAGGGGTATVRFLDPQRFTDFIEAGPAPANQERLMRNLADFGERTGRGVVPAGRTLEIEFTDIDLEGRMSNRPRPTRVTRGPESARAQLNYRLLDADGRVLREGSDGFTRSPAALSAQRAFDRDTTLQLVADGLAAWMRRIVAETSPAPGT
ncbi:MAG: DUF3016 domain-containing protein [Limisphaerales bacterium]